MAEKYTVALFSKNYSSWSLRAWIVLKESGLAFDEVVIASPSQSPETKALIHKYSPSGKLPVLIFEDQNQQKHHIWDSLAICEYLAETNPNLWPKDKFARAHARSISAEMHSGFQTLRSNMPMNCRARLAGKGMALGVKADIDRITAIWRECRTKYGKDGPFLFGEWTIADAMFCPVVLRFVTYGVTVDEISSAYISTTLSRPFVKQWLEAAEKENVVFPHYEF